MSSFAYQSLRKIGFSDVIAEQVSQKMKAVSYQEGDIISERGNVMSQWQMIIDGYVASTTVNGNIPISVFGPQMWFGEHALFDSSHSGIDYLCLSPVESLQMPRHLVSDLIFQDADFVRNLLKVTVWRSQRAQEIAVTMKSSGHAYRVVLGLAQALESFLSLAGSVEIESLPPNLNFQFNQSLLAKYCGVSRTIFSECVQKLQEDALLNIHYRGINFLQLDVWLNFLAFRRTDSSANPKVGLDNLVREMRVTRTELALDSSEDFSHEFDVPTVSPHRNENEEAMCPSNAVPFAHHYSPHEQTNRLSATLSP